jgi:CRISPR/Cas system CMR-associated protein Cmr3 (group 5 of RAMP superfamily)
MIIDPKFVRFESKDDLIDYVSKGIFPPPKSNFDAVMQKINNPDEVDDTFNAKKGHEVIVPNFIFKNDQDRTSLKTTLGRVYKNRKKNQNKILAGIAIVLGGLAIHKYKK